MSGFKICFRCDQNLPIESFYKHARMRDGRLNKCVKCTKDDVNKNRLENIEHYRAFDKARASQPKRVLARANYIKTVEGKAARSRANRLYAERFPNRRNAQHTLGNALRDGKITKTHCFICGNGKVEGHHPDYERPLDVIWLCNEHHRETHAMVADLRYAA